jgi:outer membrane protein OmpA-like peptidoglycan-associated protein
MSKHQKIRKSIISVLAAVCGLVLISAGVARAGGPLSEEQILNALTPPAPPNTVHTRALTLTPEPQQDPGQQSFIKGLRSNEMRPRGLTLDERNEVADIARQRPAVDLEIYFDYNSSEIAAKAVPDLMNLGRALTNPGIQGGVFLVGGYTDAKGGQDYNQPLSERRAQSVRQFLIQNFRIAPDSLVATGYGKEHLKIPSEPFAAENRRVQVTNLQSKQEAEK